MRYKRDNSYHTKTTSESDDDECTTTGWNFNMDDLLDGHDDEENDMPVRYEVSVILCLISCANYTDWTPLVCLISRTRLLKIWREKGRPHKKNNLF